MHVTLSLNHRIKVPYPGFRQQPRPWQDRQVELTLLGFPLVYDQAARPNLTILPPFPHLRGYNIATFSFPLSKLFPYKDKLQLMP